MAIRNQQWDAGRVLVPKIMMRVEHIATLVEIGFLDRQLLFDLKGDTLNDVRGQIVELGSRTDNRVEVTLLTNRYVRGNKLLNDISDELARQSSRQTPSGKIRPEDFPQAEIT